MGEEMVWVIPPTVKHPVELQVSVAIRTDGWSGILRHEAMRLSGVGQITDEQINELAMRMGTSPATLMDALGLMARLGMAERRPATWEKSIDIPAADATYPAFPLRSRRTWVIPDKSMQVMVSDYPHLDVEAELRRAHAWLTANPARRKTASGMIRFLNGWLSRARPEADNRKPVQEKEEVSYDPEAIIVPPDDAYLGPEKP